MHARTLLGLAAAGAVAAVAVGSQSILAQEATIEFEPRTDTRTASWIDIEGEAAYRVSGNVSYLPPASCTNMLDIPGERVEFDDELPADTTTFTLPAPEDERLTWAKETTFNIEAMDANGQRIASNGYAVQTDPICTPEMIAEELAAAGTGFEPERLPLAQLVALLGAAGASLVASGWLLRRRVI